MIDETSLWQEILSEIQKKISKPSYDTWIKDTQLEQYNTRHMVISAPNSFIRDWLTEHYTELVESVCEKVTGSSVSCQFTIKEESQKNLTQKTLPVLNSLSLQEKSLQKTTLGEGEDGARLDVQTTLNNKYTFETFVVGDANRFAHAASLAVAEAPAQSYNPLFIYGGVGLGKTHLMHAIGHYVFAHQPHLKVMYMTSEKFTNEFIHAIRDNRTVNFRNKYRNVDVLLIDDIQFLAGKEQTQEEFFHTFNALHGANKQIVISSDRAPKEIPTLEERLRSRFEWGLITDIQPPDLETRIAILYKKAKADNINVPGEVINYIASQISNNIRELEGAFIRVIAYSSLMNQDLDVDLAREALKDILKPNEARPLSVTDIQSLVAEYYGISVADMNSKKRTKALTLPRQIAMFLARELTDGSLPQIGSHFGGRDHTTVLHAYEKIKKQQSLDLTLQNQIKQIQEKLKHLHVHA